MPFDPSIVADPQQQQPQAQDAPPSLAGLNLDANVSPPSAGGQGPDLSRTYQSPEPMPTSGFGGKLKDMLQRFAYYGGQAALKHVGLPTDDELQMHNAQIQNVQSEIQARAAQTKQMQSMVTLPNGMTLPFALAQKVFPAMVTGQSREAVAETGAEAKKSVAQLQYGPGLPLDETVAQLAGYPELANQPVGKAAFDRITKTIAAKGYAIKDLGNDGQWLTDRAGNKLKYMGQSAKIAGYQAQAQARAANTQFQTSDENGVPITISVAQAIRTGAPALGTWNTVFGPTGSTKTQAQAAGAVADHIPAFRQAVQNLQAKGELGPVMGRLNQYLTQGYGGSDPDVSEFLTTVGLLKTGSVRAHFGARGGAQVLSTFDRYLNAGQTGPALLGSINAIDSFLKTYKSVGIAQPPKTNIPAGQATAGSQPKINDIKTFPNGAKGRWDGKGWAAVQ